jgi:glycosyltransferase involved in cell wall biosynthesis
MLYLSILIVTLKDREEQFEELHTHLMKQIEENNFQDEVEIVVFQDDYEYLVGMKRNVLLEEATGLFTVFVDDDDLVPDDYVKTIVDIIKNNPDIDCIGFKGLLVSEDLGNKEFIHSVKYKEYSKDEKYYYRPPLHINPIKTEIAKQFKFPVLNRGEDFDWAIQILRSGQLHNEVFIDKIMYYYRFEWAKTAAQRRRDIDYD